VPPRCFARLLWQVGGRTAAAREAQLAEALAHVSAAAAAAATAAATAAGAAALPAYEPARVHALLQQLGGGPAYALPLSRWPERQRRRRRGGEGDAGGSGGAGVPLPALPWVGSRSEPAEASALWQQGHSSIRKSSSRRLPESEDTMSEWSGTAFTLSGEGHGSREWAPGGGPVAGGGPRRHDLRDDGGGARRLEAARMAVAQFGPTLAAPLAAAAGAAKEVPGAVARAPVWLGAQAANARAQLERLARAAQGDGREKGT
jgi:hypothetical protein